MKSSNIGRIIAAGMLVSVVCAAQAMVEVRGNDNFAEKGKSSKEVYSGSDSDGQPFLQNASNENRTLRDFQNKKRKCPKSIKFLARTGRDILCVGFVGTICAAALLIGGFASYELTHRLG